MMHDTRSSRVEELEIQAQTYYMEVCGGWAGDGVGSEMGLDGRWGWVGDGVGWEMGLGRRWGWVGDGVGSEMGLGGRWGWVGDGGWSALL